jgi:dipeptidyl aminopeptidase/acylaminoacyl peptidase
VLVLAWAFQERIAFPAFRRFLPDPVPHGLPDARVVEIGTGDGVTLRGWYLPPRPAPALTAPGLLWFPGNAETVASLAPLIRELRPPGVGMLILDYRGYGESGGKVTEAALYRDAETAWGYLASQPQIDRARIAVYGRSVGTAPALHVAVTRHTRAVAARAVHHRARAGARALLVPAARVAPARARQPGPAQRLRAPLLVFLGTEDGIVPFAMGRAVADAGHAREMGAVAGAGHNDLHDVAGDRYRDKLHAFLGAALGF